MKKIKISLEYGCFPVCIYDEENRLIDNDLPVELIDDEDIDPSFVHIQEHYDSLFVNDERKFEYLGFKTAAQRELFLEELSSAVNKLKRSLNGEYVVEANMSKIRESLD